MDVIIKLKVKEAVESSLPTSLLMKCFDDSTS